MIRRVGGCSITITDAEGREITLEDCGVRFDSEGFQHQWATAVVTEPAAFPTVTMEATTSVSMSHFWMSRGFRHTMGLHTPPRRLGRTEAERAYRLSDSERRHAQRALSRIQGFTP